MIVKIAKFSLYPKDSPVGYAVGFDISLENNRSFYRDTIVDFEVAQGKDDQGIIQEAWNLLEEEINNEAERLGQLPSFIGQEWCPGEKNEE